MAFMSCGYEHKLSNLSGDGNTGCRVCVCIQKSDFWCFVSSCVSYQCTSSVSSAMYHSTRRCKKNVLLVIAACECGLHRDRALSPSVCLCGANISESPTSLWQFRQMFRRSLVQECPGIKYACSGVKRVTSLRSRWIAMNICARGGLMPSTSPLCFSVSTRLYFLPTVSRERAIAESTGEPLHSEADFYFF